MSVDFGFACDRRMPVYPLLDVSGSMVGAPVQALEQGVLQLQNELLGQPQAVEMVHMGVITFADTACQMVPLTSITSLAPLDLTAGGVTSLGAGMRLLGQAIAREVAPVSATQKGDYRALVMILIGSSPTDDWRSGLADLKQSGGPKLGNVVALGCGDAVDTEVLAEVAEHVLLMTDVTSDNLRSFFRWESQSVTWSSSASF